MKKLLILFFLLSYSLHSQYLSLFDIDTTSFPTMKAKFFAYDKEGKQIKNFSISDFVITEDGIKRKIINVSCPPEKPPIPISSVLVFDISGSMIGGPPRIESAKQAANAWIDGLLNPNSECALVSFSDYSYILHDFTKNRQTLKQTISKLIPTAGTDYNQALIDLPSGGLNIAKDGKYKRVIIFLTDGLPNFEPKTNEIIQFAKENDITIYAITLDMPAPQCIKEMTRQTGGDFFENITTLQEAINTYEILSKRVQVTEPCLIEWESIYVCKSGKTNFELEYSTFIGKSYYFKPTNSIAKLEFNPTHIRLQNPQMGINTQEVTVTAKNAPFDILDIKSSNPLFDINPKQFKLNPNESKKLQVTYNAQDSSLNFAYFEFVNNLCSFKYYTSAGRKGVKPKVPTIKLTNPNGGEKFIVGSDTLITWEGLMPEDSVVLEISKDTGKNWENITKSATGLRYNWQNIPKPASNDCLIRIKQLENNQNLNSDNTLHLLWQKSYGGTDFDNLYSIIESRDENYVVAGYTASSDGDLSGYHGNGHYWVVKLNPSDGKIIWQKSYGGTNFDKPYSIIESSDGNYIVAGYTASTDGDVTENHGNNDFWVIKVNSSNGNLIWQKTYGGSSIDKANSIIESSDGNYVVAGYTDSNDGDLSGNHGYNFDYWVIKISPNDGSIIWQKTYGGSNNDEATSIIESSDGNYVIAGSSNSKDGDVKTDHSLFDCYDYWIVKINSIDGSIIWQKTYGGTNSDEATSIIEASDGNYVIAGFSESNDGDVKTNHELTGSSDYWIVKINSIDGSIIWQKTYGGSTSVDEATSIIESSDGNYVVAGYAASTDGDVTGGHGDFDYWVCKLRYDDGALIWQKSLGGRNSDKATSIIESSDRNYVVAGYATSTDGDIAEGHGGYDYWVCKISVKIEFMQEDQSDAVFSIVEPIPDAENIDMGKVLVGTGKDSVVTNFMKNIGSYKFNVDSIYFTGADANAFSLVSGLPQYSIEPNSTHYGEFHFAPIQARVYNANVVIITQSDTLTRTITGEGVLPVVQVFSGILDFGKVELGQENTIKDTVLLTNIGLQLITITNTITMLPDIEQFNIISGGGGFSLNPGESRKLTIQFKPKYGGRTSGRIGFEYNGVGSPAEVQLFGTGIGGLVTTNSDSAYAGDKWNLQLKLNNVKPGGLRFLATQFSADITFQSTITVPEDNSIIKNKVLDTTTITVRGEIPNSNIFASVPMVAALGNVEETYLQISNFKLYDALGMEVDYDVEYDFGKFKLLGICRDGGTRLINPSGEAGIESIAPNPAVNSIDLEFSTSEIGLTEISIYNTLGERVLTAFSEDISETGKRNIKINSSEIGNGTYMVIFKSPTVVDTQQIMIVK